ncbi:MAG: PIN domain-containing protein [Deltaproteobacteria bacterium]|nr:PIN domain-containing protein [Deltaproteobacteria bacterium]
MTGKVFVDTNVLVYWRDASEPDKQEQALAWLSGLWERRRGRLSFQVLQEFYVTVTAKLALSLSPELARLNVRQLLAWKPVTLDDRLLEEAWRLQDRYRFPWWDALIAAAAQISDCRYLLSEDFQDGMEMGDLQVVNPFLNRPEDF